MPPIQISMSSSMRLPPGIPIDPALLDAVIMASDAESRAEAESSSSGYSSSSNSSSSPQSFENQNFDESIESTIESSSTRPLTDGPIARSLPPSPRYEHLTARKPLPHPYIYTPPVRTNYTPTPTSYLFKNYLHKLPHLCFTEQGESGTCLACDVATASVHYTCDGCGLVLCGICHYLITEEPIRGSLRLLVQHIARWKFGYSPAFLERERKEAEADRERMEEERKRREREWKERRVWRRGFISGEGDEGLGDVSMTDEMEEEEGGVSIDEIDDIQEMIERMERERFPEGNMEEQEDKNEEIVL